MIPSQFEYVAPESVEEALAALAERDRAVRIGNRARLGGDEAFARHRGHGGDDQGIGHALRAQLAVDHRPTRRGMVEFGGL